MVFSEVSEFSERSEFSEISETSEPSECSENSNPRYLVSENFMLSPKSCVVVG